MKATPHVEWTRGVVSQALIALKNNTKRVANG